MIRYWHGSGSRLNRFSQNFGERNNKSEAKWTQIPVDE